MGPHSPGGGRRTSHGTRGLHKKPFWTLATGVDSRTLWVRAPAAGPAHSGLHERWFPFSCPSGLISVAIISAILKISDQNLSCTHPSALAG